MNSAIPLVMELAMNSVMELAILRRSVSLQVIVVFLFIAEYLKAT